MRSKEVPSTHALEHVLEAGQLEVGPNPAMEAPEMPRLDGADVFGRGIDADRY